MPEDTEIELTADSMDAYVSLFGLNDQNIALVKCQCGRSQVPYSESRVLQIDLPNPYMHDENNHFDLLVPPGWNEEKWQKICKQLTRW